MSQRPVRLSKSRFVAGTQCPKLLWWRVHEPDAPELQPDQVLQDRFDQGTHVGEVAQQQFPGGLLIDFEWHEYEAKIQATQEALRMGVPAIFEACFAEDETFVAVDVLERTQEGFNLIEVKSSSSQKPEHVPDAAVQVHVLRQAGVPVSRVEIMHLNSDYRYPMTEGLFKRTEITQEVEELLGQVPADIEKQLEVLRSPEPAVSIGAHCFDPRECSFRSRCWPHSSDHILKLSGVGPKTGLKYMDVGINRIGDLPKDKKLSAAAARQVRSMEEGRLIVEPGLREALREFEGLLGFLDFETVSRAIPVWDGLGPWHATTAQFSYHENEGSDEYSHIGWLAEGPGDPRPALAQALVEATADAEKIVMYSSFERTRIRKLAVAVPALATQLQELEDKLIDLLPVIRNNVYHPEFQGSFSLKYTLPALVPELTYDDLVIVDGLTASVEIARLLFVAHKVAPAERDRLREDLLAYCERDTWAMVRLLEELRILADKA